MTYHPTIHQLVKELYKLLSTHYCTVVPVMIEKKKYFEEIFSQKKGIRDYSISVFDLKERRFTFHDSHYNKYLKSPSIYTALVDDMTHLNNLTEIENLRFCLDTLKKSLELLRSLTPEECQLFNVIYIRRLLEKDGQYHPYVHHMYVSHYDPDGNPWLIATETKRLLEMNIPEFRRFSPPTPQYTEEHKYSAHLLNLKLDEMDIKLIEKHQEDCKKKGISETLKRSPHTVSNLYIKVNALFEVKSINTACLVAKIVGIV